MSTRKRPVLPGEDERARQMLLDENRRLRESGHVFHTCDDDRNDTQSWLMSLVVRRGRLVEKTDAR